MQENHTGETRLIFCCCSAHKNSFLESNILLVLNQKHLHLHSCLQFSPRGRCVCYSSNLLPPVQIRAQTWTAGEKKKRKTRSCYCLQDEIYSFIRVISRKHTFLFIIYKHQRYIKKTICHKIKLCHNINPKLQWMLGYCELTLHLS